MPQDIALSLEQDPQLYGAVNDLMEIDVEAREKDFPTPSVETKIIAESTLRVLHQIPPWRFEVYPMPEGEIAINASGVRRHSVLIICDLNGGAWCSVNMDSAHRRAYYSDMSVLPDSFVREALEELKQVRDSHK